MNKQNNIAVEDLAEPLTYPVEAFISPEYAKAERELLWPKVWQMAGRLEDIPDVGNFFTYNILDESIIVVRTAPDKISAFYNVCPHRGRQLINTPDDCNQVRGKKQHFVCGFRGWQYDLEGKNTFVLDPQGEIQLLEITPEGVGRNAAELLRKIKALQYWVSHPGEVCPAKWEEGAETLAPSLDLVGKI